MLATSVPAVNIQAASLAQLRDDLGRKANVPICFEGMASDVALASKALISLATTNNQRLSNIIWRLNMEHPHLHFSCVEGILLCRTKESRAMTNNPMDVVIDSFHVKGVLDEFVSKLVMNKHVLTSVRHPPLLCRSVDIAIPSGLTMREALARLARRYSIEWFVLVDPTLVERKWMRVAIDFAHPSWPTMPSNNAHRSQ